SWLGRPSLITGRLRSDVATVIPRGCAVEVSSVPSCLAPGTGVTPVRRPPRLPSVRYGIFSRFVGDRGPVLRDRGMGMRRTFGFALVALVTFVAVAPHAFAGTGGSTVTVTTRAWLDLDGDGIRADAEPPLTGVTCVL